MNIEYCKFQEFITKPVISKQEIQLTHLDLERLNHKSMYISTYFNKENSNIL